MQKKQFRIQRMSHPPLGGFKKRETPIFAMVAYVSRTGTFGTDCLVLGTKDYRRERAATFSVGARNACHLALFCLAHGD
jgi:hypothetical protein